MANDQDLESRADPAFEQFFLVNPDKIKLLIQAAGIKSTDHVVEFGAGVGTVSRSLPESASLTLVELDDRLVEMLATNVPAARIIQGDAVELVETLRIDVLIGNLPTKVTEQLFAVLPRLEFRTAVLAVDSDSDMSELESSFIITPVTHITGDDFRPPQQSVSQVLQLARR